MDSRRIKVVPLVAIPILYVWHLFEPAVKFIIYRGHGAFKSKRQLYLEEVLASLNKMACVDPRGRDHKLKDNSSVSTLIGARYAENQSPYRAAIFIAASLQSHFIETLTADQRVVLVRQLQNTDYGQIANALESAVKDEISEFPDGLTFETTVIAISIFIARALLEDGKIEQSEFEMFDSEVFGALAGKSPDQRAHERLSTLFEESRRKSQ